ncbi:hypothetical protein BGZ93_008019 [Podila epicladia]|nr:hypothetical protein BGZ92_009304 [Podila epicladia]KAG0093119.1 hypothetical protein BGZ93_008019 [Podila epicladia]
MTDNRLNLFCLVEGESISSAFPIKTLPHDSTGDLKRLIMAEVLDTFNGVNTKDLTIWRVSIPNDDDDDDIPILLNNVTSDKKKLGLATRLSKVFPRELPEETIHIIVQRPPTALKRGREHDFEDPRKLPKISDWVKYAAKDGPVDLPPLLVSLLNNGQFMPAPRNEFKQQLDNIPVGQKITLSSIGQRPKC